MGQLIIRITSEKSLKKTTKIINEIRKESEAVFPSWSEKNKKRLRKGGQRVLPNLK